MDTGLAGYSAALAGAIVVLVEIIKQVCARRGQPLSGGAIRALTGTLGVLALWAMQVFGLTPEQMDVYATGVTGAVTGLGIATVSNILFNVWQFAARRFGWIQPTATGT